MSAWRMCTRLCWAGIGMNGAVASVFDGGGDSFAGLLPRIGLTRCGADAEGWAEIVNC